MTPEEASIILCSCPPGDETNPDIPGLVEARELAIEHKALGAWWTEERKFDQIFRRKLASITPPPELATTIMRGGATIFFASRLISETSTEDEIVESQSVDVAVAEEELIVSAMDGSSEVEFADEPDRPSSSWLWRITVACLIAVATLALLGLSFLLLHHKSP